MIDIQVIGFWQYTLEDFYHIIGCGALSKYFSSKQEIYQTSPVIAKDKAFYR
jgi:hypothetical protein